MPVIPARHRLGEQGCECPTSKGYPRKPCLKKQEGTGREERRGRGKEEKGKREEEGGRVSTVRHLLWAWRDAMNLSTERKECNEEEKARRCCPYHYDIT